MHNLIWVQLEAYGALNNQKNSILNEALEQIKFKTINLSQTVCAAPSTVMTSMGMLTGVSPIFLAKDHIPKSQTVPQNFQAVGFTAISDFLEEQGYQVKGINAVYDSPRFLPMFKDTHEGVTPDMGKEVGCNFWQSWCVVQRTKNILSSYRSNKKAAFFHLMDADILPKIISLLETVGFNENNTVLVLVGDHGWPIRFKDKEPALFHDLHQEENNIRVSCHLAYPGSSSTSYDHFNSALDLAPTVLDIMDFPPLVSLPKAHGISLKPYIKENSPSPERIVRIDNRYIAQKKNRIITLVNSKFRYTYRHETDWQHQPYYQYRFKPVKENEELYTREDIEESNNLIHDISLEKVIEEFRAYFEKSETDILNHFYGENLFEHYLLKDFSPRMISDEVQRIHSSKRIQKILLTLLRAELVNEGVSKIVLYGAGNHSRSILELGILNDLIKVIIDDSPLVESLMGIPVIKPAEHSRFNFESIVISSDYFETQLYERAKEWCPKDTSIKTLYEAIGSKLSEKLMPSFDSFNSDSLDKIFSLLIPENTLLLTDSFPGLSNEGQGNIFSATETGKLINLNSDYLRELISLNSNLPYKKVGQSLESRIFDLIIYKGKNIFELTEWLSNIDKHIEACGVFLGLIKGSINNKDLATVLPEDFYFNAKKIGPSTLFIGHLWRFNS